MSKTLSTKQYLLIIATGAMDAAGEAPPGRRRSVRWGEADGDAQSDLLSAQPTATPQKVQEFFKDLPPNTVQRASPRTDTKSLPVGVLKDTPARAVTAANRAARAGSSVWEASSWAQ